MKNINVTIRMEEDLKQKAEQLFAELGMSLSTALNVFLRQAVREQQIPFAITRQQPNALTEATIEAAEAEKELYGPFDTVDALMEALNA